MRDLSPTPLLRLAGFVIVGAAIWLVASWLSPDRDRLAELTLEGVAKTLFDGPDALPADLAVGTVTRGAWSPPCDHALAVLARRAPKAPAATAFDLTLDCAVGPDAVRLAATRPDTPTATVREAPLPGYASLLPPLFGILCALIFRKVLLALFAAVALGALLADDWAIGPAIERTASTYLVETVADGWNLYIFGFTILLVGMIHVCIRMGGMQGVVDRLSRIARGRRSAQTATAVVGTAVFFDDYANTVVVGSSLRPLTDIHRISREKLAYIVDSTAAPIAGLAVISTWIGFEISVFNEQLEHLGGIAANGYEFFFQILPYRFYCIFALALVYLVAFTGRDFGPMLKAERRALRQGQLRAPENAHHDAADDSPPRRDTSMKPGAPARWVNGVLPIVIVILGTFAASVVVGADALAATRPDWATGLGLFAQLREAFIAASDDTMAILFWAAAAGTAAAFALAFAQRILTPNEAGRAFVNGLWMVAPVIAILILAIALRKVTQDLGTPIYLVALIGDVAIWVLPITVFALAAFIAFATGTSWGTMGILIPVAIPLVAALADGHPEGTLILLLTGASVLDGAIFGDHCSLISDTTIMSSLSSSCDHVDHVRTQLPYASLAMLVAGGLGYGLVAWAGADLPVVLVYVAGVAFMWLWLRVIGKEALP